MLGPKMLSKLHIGSHLRLNRAHTSVLGHLPRGSKGLVAQIIENHSPSDLLHSNVDIPPISMISEKKKKHIIGGCVTYEGWAEPPKILIPLRHLFLMHGQTEPANWPLSRHPHALRRSSDSPASLVAHVGKLGWIFFGRHGLGCQIIGYIMLLEEILRKPT